MDTAKACAEWRWIGISRPEARCPEVEGWTVRPLFPQIAPVQPPSGDYCATDDSRDSVPRLDLIRELNRFCVYEIDASRNKWSKSPSFPPAPSAGLVRLDQDCAALSPSEKYLDGKTWTSESKDLLAQAGKPEAPLDIEHQRGVRLAFLDTQPTFEGVPTFQGNSPHGYTLATIAHDLVCTPGSEERCAAQITTRLAMPILAFDPKDPKHNRISKKWGGYFGMQSDLAEAIRSEVDSWRAQTPRPRHLVLNLSMAWDGELFGGLDEEQIAEMRAGTQAVYLALQYAASFDVLVVASAGNQKREPCENYGPLLPAAWESRAPQEQENTCGNSREAYQPPLLYAVGGVRADGQRLGNARPGGMPQRAAYGETAVFTGSSVATAIVSSTAAVVWNAFPDLSRGRLMDILYSGGDDLGFPADIWSSTISEPPNVHRVSLCKALQKACSENGPHPCPLETRCEELRVSALLGHTPKPAAQGSCQPWLFPQPEDNPCPACIKPPNG